MAFKNPYIYSALQYSPLVIERLIEKVPASSYDDRPDPDRFTIREIVCHLADWEPFFLERLRGAVTLENFQIVPYDEGLLVIENDYAHQDVHEALERYKTGRKAFIAYADSLSPEQLDRMAFHPERGHLSASDQVSLVVGHDMYHIEQISARL